MEIPKLLPGTQGSLPQGKLANMVGSGGMPEDTSRNRRNYEQGLIGFVNIGNSCYVNATLQAISNCPPFCQYFVENIQVPPSQSAAGSLSGLMKKVWTSDRNPGHLSPRVVTSAMKNQMFKGSQQQDAQEFLRCLLTQIHDEIGIQVPPTEEWLCRCGHRSYDHNHSCCRDSMVSCDSDTSADSHSSQSRLVSSARNSPLNRKKSGSPRIKFLNSPRSSKIIMTSSAKSSVENIPTSIRGSKCSLESQQEEKPGRLEWSKDDVFLVDVIDKKVTAHRNYFTSSQKRTSLRDASHDPESSNQVTSLDNTESSLHSDNTCVTSDPTPPDQHSISSPNHNNPSPSPSPVSDVQVENTPPPLLPPPVDTKAISSPSTTNQSTSTSTPLQSKTGQQRSPRTTSIVSEVFEGILESRVKCLTCKKVSVTREPFQDLSLPIPGRKEIAKFNSKLDSSEEEKDENAEREGGRGKLSQGFCSVWNFMTALTRDLLIGPPTDIKDCLNAFFDTSELRGDNRYYCSHCKSFQNSLKEMSIVKLPEVLCVHLKRFRFDAYFSTKISRHIKFPLTGLDMASYLKEQQQESSVYELNTVITHYGGAAGGHYVAFAKNAPRNIWYEFNDTHVHPVSAETVQNAEGYVLFYRRVPSSESQALDTLSLLPPSGTTLPSPDVCYISRHWLHLLKHCSHPGPIFQYDFACRHGAVHPTKTLDKARSLALSIRREVWDTYQKKYGGGPLVQELETCQECKELLIQLHERRQLEKDEVHKVQAKDKSKKIEPYLISMEWLDQWKNFIHCTTLEVRAPPPIDNTVLLQQSEDKSLTLMEGAPFRKVTQGVWDFFHRTYGGGPLLVTTLEPINS